MHVIIQEGSVGLLWQKGKIVRELRPGQHRFWKSLGQNIQAVDIRPTQFATATEEYATKDSLIVRCTISFRWSIVDATTFVRTTADPYSLLRTTATDALRQAVSILTLDELLAQKTEIHAALSKALVAALAPAGIKIETVSPLNLLIPRSLRQAFEAEVAARKRAAADLEEVRGRTAALRNLANAAALVEQKPVLLQLLLGQKAKNVQFQFTDAADTGKKSQTQ